MEKNNKIKELIRVLKFTIVSISAAIVQILVFFILNDVFHLKYGCNAISIVASVIWNFTINRKITFKAADNIKRSMLLVALFYVVFIPASELFAILLTNNNWNEYLVEAIIMLSNFVLEFLYTRYVVYRKSCDTISKVKKVYKRGFLYKIVMGLLKTFYKKREFINSEFLENGPILIIGNHAQIHGPLSSMLYFPVDKKIWCAGEMMHLKEVPSYAYKDFWSLKPRWIKWFYKLLSYIIAPIASYMFKRADTIGVYHDVRVVTTFRSTVNSLHNGESIVIFPECIEEYNDIVNQFQERFVDVAKMYYDKYGVKIAFIPMYNSGELKKIVFGRPIYYDNNLDIKKQRTIVCNYLKDEITRLAKELPIHKVVPYKNVKKKDYPLSN